MRQAMKIDDVRRTAYSMPLTSPSFPPGPYRFFNREYFVITYRTDPAALAAVVQEPLEITDAIVKYEFIRMPDSTGFGDYTETGQVIPVRLNGEDGAYTHAMYLDDDAPIAGGRELWGFPKKRASPKIEVESDVLVGSLHYGSVLCASGTMGYKHRPVDHDTVLKSMKAPNFILKIIPHEIRRLHAFQPRVMIDRTMLVAHGAGGAEHRTVMQRSHQHVALDLDFRRSPLFGKSPQLAAARDRRIVIEIHRMGIGAVLAVEADRDHLAGFGVVAEAG